MSFIASNLLGPSATHYGLGNQMFGVAAALSHAEDNNIKAVFPCLLDRNRYGSYCDNIFRNLNIENPPAPVQNFYKEPKFSFSKIPKKQNMVIEGYFQSERYFAHNRDLILKTFTLPYKIESYLNFKYSKILSLKNTVSVHIRRGDYLTNFKGCFEILDNEYYSRAFNCFDKESVFVFFGEHEKDSIYFKENFNLKNSFFIHDDDIIDLFLMSKLKNNIIANSSFSWWGAWLNQNKEKKVVAPQKWFGKDNPSFKNSDKITVDLIPKEWIRL